MSLLFDENGTPLCPMILGSGEWPTEDAAEKVYAYGPCGAEMYLHVHLRIDPGEGYEVVSRDDFTRKNSTTSSWTFECHEGHVLAVSSEEEDAEDFDLRRFI